ncbi:uncharacterized protein FIBRA_08873 [Fibroporia radiculosa]|uniref:Uncharacterized protein n=1 Tax=Fibroporia radiculosa TaxID=599839 RepID=J4H5E4_9APHY|nr:uncharacterized protein FIBRA_08873 [Fibroporia radiculosa]CCM06594.1 predicted protein [Fibroporia radiculosa]
MDQSIGATHLPHGFCGATDVEEKRQILVCELANLCSEEDERIARMQQFPQDVLLLLTRARLQQWQYNDNAAFIGSVVNEFLLSHKWMGRSSPEASVVMISVNAKTIPDDDSSIGDKIHVAFGFGYFECNVLYDKSKGTLAVNYIHLVVPGYGRTIILRNIQVDLSRKPPVQYDVAIPSQGTQIYGHFGFAYNGNPGEVVKSYDLTTPFTGEIVDTVSVFPSFVTSQPGDQKSEVLLNMQYHSEDYDAAPESVAEVHYRETGKSSFLDNEVLLRYLANYAHQLDALYVVVVDLFTKGESDAARNTVDASMLSLCTFQLNFAIFELAGSIDPKDKTMNANLFCNVPISGRVRLAIVAGVLDNNAFIPSIINVFVAKGRARFKSVKNGAGTHDFMCTLEMDIALVGNINLAESKIWTLPSVLIELKTRPPLTYASFSF